MPNLEKLSIPIAPNHLEQLKVSNLELQRAKQRQEKKREEFYNVQSTGARLTRHRFSY